MPLLEGFGVAGGKELERSILRGGVLIRPVGRIALKLSHRAQRFSPEAIIRDSNKPLVTEIGLDGDVRSIAVAHRMLIITDVLEQLVISEPVNDGDPSLFARPSDEGASVVGHVFPAVAI